MQKFSELVRYFRERSKLNMTQLADRMNVTPAYVMNLESGRKKPPTLERCEMIANILNLNPSEKKQIIDAAMTERMSPELLEWMHNNTQDVQQIPLYSLATIKKWNPDKSSLPEGEILGYRATTTRGQDMFAILTASETGEALIFVKNMIPKKGNTVLIRQGNQNIIVLYSDQKKDSVIGVAVEKRVKLI